ncbi:hypothetical protein BH20VER3_BH20VER3_00570 [soil metagenome]
MDEFDETALCYFAALIEGLRLVIDKERDLGLEPGSVALDSDALVHFVSRKGDRLVQLMSANENGAKGPYIRWTEQEMELVAAELARHPGDYERAQEVLPAARRRPTFNPLMKEKLTRRLPSPSVAVAPVVTSPAARNGSALSPRPSDELTDVLATQIAAAVTEMAVKALCAAADKLRAGSSR